MPKVGKKTYPYTKAGMAAAKKEAAKMGKTGGSMARGMAARAKKRTTDARAKAQAKRASRAQAARTQRMKAKSKKR